MNDEERGTIISSSLTRNVENDFVAKTTIEERSGLGRVVIALQNFEVGDVILRESPVVVWGSGSWLYYMDEFQALSDEDQAGILDMFHPPLDQATNNSNLSLVDTSFEKGQLLRKLISIADTNAHEYYGRASPAFTETAVLQGNDLRSNTSALFLYASKVAHSCRPNSSYTSKTSDGKLEYKAIRSIQEGEMITFSYIDKLCQTPTCIRRQKLMETKKFLCKCDRCLSPDYCHSFPCPDCENVVPRCPADSEQEYPWYCTVCKKPLDEQQLLQLEALQKNKAEQLERGLMMNITAYRPAEVKDIVTAASTALGRLHHITLRIMEEYAKLCASHAHHVDNYSAMLPPPMVAGMFKAFGSPQSNRKQAGIMGLELTRACECIEVGCIKKVCDENHPPSYEMARTVFHAAQDLMKGGKWTKETARHVRSYLTLMRIMWGPDDNDVADIEESLGVAASSGAMFLSSGGSSKDTPKQSPTSTLQAQKKPSKRGKNNGKKPSNKKKGRKK